MVSSDKHTVLSLEQAVQRTAVYPSSTKTLSGLIDHAAVIAETSLASVLFLLHQIQQIN